MLKLLLFLLDLVLMTLMSFSISGNTPTLFSFGLGVLITIRVLLNTIVRHQLDIQIPPATAINALLQTTSAPQNDRCLICHADDMFEPRKLSCNHVFCRDCALLMLCRRDTCPHCGKVSLQQVTINIIWPFETMVALLEAHAVNWVGIFTVLSLAWIAPCFWQSRVPTISELMLAVTRATIHTALRAEIVDMAPNIAYFRSRPHRVSWLVEVVAVFCTSVVTLPYDYAAWIYFSLFVAWATWEHWNDAN